LPPAARTTRPLLHRQYHRHRIADVLVKKALEKLLERGALALVAALT
jgi:hypothetical protein